MACLGRWTLRVGSTILRFSAMLRRCRVRPPTIAIAEWSTITSHCVDDRANVCTSTDGRDRTLMLRSHCCVLILRSRAAALWRRLHSMEYRWLGST